MCPKTLFTAALITQCASQPLQRCYGPLRIIKGAGQAQTLLRVMGCLDLKLVTVGVIKDRCVRLATFTDEGCSQVLTNDSSVQS